MVKQVESCIWPSKTSLKGWKLDRISYLKSFKKILKNFLKGMETGIGRLLLDRHEASKTSLKGWKHVFLKEAA